MKQTIESVETCEEKKLTNPHEKEKMKRFPVRIAIWILPAES
jgi:hypothetical protein